MTCGTAFNLSTVFFLFFSFSFRSFVPSSFCFIDVLPFFLYLISFCFKFFFLKEQKTDGLSIVLPFFETRFFRDSVPV